MTDCLTPLYLYLDVETPGLYAEQGVLEVAWFASTDINELKPVILSRLNDDIDETRAYDEAVDYVKAMHTSSGLWKRLNDPIQRTPLHEIDYEIWSMIHRHKGPVYLVGNSIRLDRAVLERWFPMVARVLHYRQIDITSVRLFLEANGLDTTTEVKVESTHVAGQDVLDSLNFARHLGELVTRPRAALRELDAELEGMLDSLDDHINQEDVAEQLTQLRARIAEALS
ncbi:DNA binding protein [Microbacterium phage Dewdrop]|nr:DNA binding protein [Microbacterium phage Leaf]QGZ17395.1 DNA binding protein [Microbacterium phage Dewdrop]